MANDHVKDVDSNMQCIEGQIGTTQIILNVVENLPMFTSAIIDDFKILDNNLKALHQTNNFIDDLDNLDRRLACLHHQLVTLSDKAVETKFDRVSNVLFKKYLETLE